MYYRLIRTPERCIVFLMSYKGDRFLEAPNECRAFYLIVDADDSEAIWKKAEEENWSPRRINHTPVDYDQAKGMVIEFSAGQVRLIPPINPGDIASKWLCGGFIQYVLASDLPDTDIIIASNSDNDEVINEAYRLDKLYRRRNAVLVGTIDRVTRRRKSLCNG